MTVVAVTGATGQVGGRVTRLLEGRPGLWLRLIVRDVARAPQVAGGSVVQATYEDADALSTALSGVDVVLMVSASESRTRRLSHRTFIEAAAAAGVGHLVYTSFVGASADAVFTLARDHHDAEQAIIESGVEFTLLRDNFYADELVNFAGPDGVIRGPAGQGRVAAVARADVADAASAVLLSPEAHRSATYQLTGPEALTMREIAQRASVLLGRQIDFADQTVSEAYATRAAYQVEQWQLDAWVSTYVAIAAGEVAAVTADVERLTGHSARTLEQAVRGG